MERERDLGIGKVSKSILKEDLSAKKLAALTALLVFMQVKRWNEMHELHLKRVQP